MILRRAATLLYTLVLRAFPSAMRTDYAAEMIDAFERELDARAAGRGAASAAMFAIAAWLDAVGAGLGERRRLRGPWDVRISWLDVKLGIRMLVRYPWLSLAGGLGIVIVVLCGTIAGLFHAVIGGSLPFDDGDRIVAIENWDAAENRPAAHDFFTWRDELRTVRDVGAYRLVGRNVAAASQPAEPVRIAEISATAFTIARVPPLMGRYLLPEDERDSAAPVVLIGYDEWQRRFAGDPQIVGRVLQVGETASTIVGVMPEGFGFPVNERYWTPLRLARTGFASRQAPSNMPYKSMPEGAVNVFGRLADGADVTAAQAELNVVGRRAAADEPTTHAHLRPRVLPYTYWFFREQHDGELVLVWGLLAVLLGVVGANVAVLVYARTATRRVEIALRTAIGASRLRIVGQLFAEGLVLSCAAAAAGLLIAVVARHELAGTVRWEQMPFWVNTSVTSPIVLTYVVAIAVLGAVVVGVFPALQATGRRAQVGLQQAAANSAGWTIGRTYGALIVVQVTLAVAILPYALSTAWTSIRDAIAAPGFAATEFLTARVDLDGAADVTTSTPALTELARHLDSEAGVTSTILLTSVPGSEPRQEIEIEGDGSRDVGGGVVAVDFFTVFQIPVLSGRGFDARDRNGATRRVVVNRAFADQIVHGNPIGRRVRESAPDGAAARPWLEIVGVVEDFHAKKTRATSADARIYRPVSPHDGVALVAVRVRGSAPTALAGRLREIATAVDRRLLLRDVRAMDALIDEQQLSARLGAWASGVATGSLLLLSAMGLYALMAFSVAQRRREIGIRIALGANPRAVVGGILSRSLWQLTIGIVLGVAVAAAFNDATASEFTGGAGLKILPLVGGLVLSIGVAAAALPARRALRIEPTEALRAQ